MAITVTTALADKVKNALRISSTSAAITAEISDTVEACLMDLQAQGVVNLDQTDALIIRACKLYARSEFNYNGKAEQFRNSYDMQKMSLALDTDYNTADEDESEGESEG